MIPVKKGDGWHARANEQGCRHGRRSSSLDPVIRAMRGSSGANCGAGAAELARVGDVVTRIRTWHLRQQRAQWSINREI